MSPRSRSSVLRTSRAWAAPLAAAAVVAAGAVALGGVHPSIAAADVHPNLPARTPLQLLTAAQTSTIEALSGTVTESAHWGLPTLPGAAENASLSWQGLLTGNHTVRVAVDGPDHQRLAVLGSLSESDLVHNGNDVWTYTSGTDTVTHSTLANQPGAKPARPNSTQPGRITPNRAGTKPGPGWPEALTPQGAAQQALSAISPSTTVSVDATQRVSGRKAYTLVLTPKDARSTVRKVTIALDSEHFVPLRVQLFGAGSTPAFQTGFTSISFTKPAASTFTFHRPAGSTLAADPFGLNTSQPDRSGAAAKPATPAVKTLGSGWATVLELPADLGKPAPGADGRGQAASPSALLNSLTSPLGTTGARVLRTAVVNALITPDGRIFVGAVSTDLLQAAAAGTYK